MTCNRVWMKVVGALLIGLLTLGAQTAGAQSAQNFADRQIIVIDNALKYLELSNFRVGNRGEHGRSRLYTDLTWKNVSTKPIIAFEMAVIYYDPFNRPLPYSGRWFIPGLNGEYWEPIKPEQSSNDTLIAPAAAPIMTAIVYVTLIRFADGEIWAFDPSAVEKEVRKKVPTLRDANLVIGDKAR